jgi:hypothetical protein
MAFRERRSRGPPTLKLCKIWCGERLCRPCALTPTRAVIKDGRRKARKEKSERRGQGKIKGRGTIAASSRCLHMGFYSTSKIATVLPRFASY